MSRARQGFTLIEILIVVVIMAVLASVVIPQFNNSTRQAQLSTAQFNLQIFRSQIELYRAQHGGRLPSSNLAEMMTTTNVLGETGTTAAHNLGPYFRVIPVNSLTEKNVVAATTKNPPIAADVTASNNGAWLYNPTTGGVWVDHADLITK